MSVIADNIERVRERLGAAAEACGRRPEEITLVAVSKNFPPECISEAIAAGQHDFGENRVQEAESKIPQFAAVPNITWHMIGHLQTNKSQRAVKLFDLIHSVDSVKLARKLGQDAREAGRQITVLIQIDLGHEKTKFGAEESQAQEIVAAVLSLPGLCLDGLMTIPPYYEEPELTRPYFSGLRKLRDRLEEQKPGCLGRGLLSMGMSNDFEIAIQEGADIIRVGTAIFGGRIY
jgi:pyridoxal phosphate enzyme (YggS family)